MKILFVFTGGTISTTLDKDVMRIDGNKPYSLIDAYEKKFGIDFKYDCVCPYFELSENNTAKTLDLLCSCVSNNIDNGYDGIVVTHGTDTLQYSACALGYCLRSNCNPVCLVSASYPLENSNSNALDNLHGAICIIKNRLGKGVFVPFRNTSDSFVKVHRATRLLPSNPFSDEVLSAKNIEYGTFDERFNFSKNVNFSEKESAQESPFLPCFSRSASVLFLNAHVGMIYPTLSKKIKYVLISSYHSGTVDTKSDMAKSFYKRAREKNIPVIISGVENGNVYESATAFSSLSLITTPLSPISAYIKLWLIANSSAPLSFLFNPLGGDM